MRDPKSEQTVTSSLTPITRLAARGQTLREKAGAKRRAKALAAIHEVEKVRMVKRLQGKDCSVPVVTLADLERREAARGKRRVISLFELLMWTYGVQKADEAEWRGRHGGFVSTETVTARVCRILAVGTLVDGAAGSFDIPADAQTVHNAVMALEGDWQAQGVIETAVAGMGPAWRSYAPEARCEPVLKGNGAVKMLWDDNRNLIGCRVSCTGVGLFERRGLDEQARARYAAWLGALKRLEGVLSTSGLKKHIIHGLGVTEQPWASEAQKELVTA